MSAVKFLHSFGPLGSNFVRSINYFGDGDGAMNEGSREAAFRYGARRYFDNHTEVSFLTLREN